MNDCHNCRFHLTNGTSPHTRCLIFYNQGIAKEKLKDGLIGKCKDHKDILRYEDEVPN